MIDHGEKAIAWREYDTQVGRTEPRSNVLSEEFRRTGLYFGQLDPDFAKQLKQVVLAAEFDPYRRDDCTPGFITAKFDAKMVSNINNTSRFRSFGAYETWLLNDMLESLKDEVADCLASPWKVLSLKAWTTPPRADNFGMYAWHSDGFVAEIFKIMVYLVPLSPETGSFEFKIDGKEIQHRSAQPGAWALFQNTEILHRGVPGTVHERVSIEITLARSASFDLRARYPGENAHWPEYPWIDALDGCVEDDAQRIAEKAKAPESLRTRLVKLFAPAR